MLLYIVYVLVQVYVCRLQLYANGDVLIYHKQIVKDIPLIRSM